MPLIIRQLEATPGRLRSKAKRDAMQIAELFVDTAQSLVGKQGSPSTPSRPGQPPRRQTGRLWAGITGTVREEGKGFLISIKGEAPYTLPVERGHGGRSPALPRPFLERTYKRIENRVRNILSRTGGR